MLGTLRFTLAWIVAAGHLERTIWNGTYAVFSFYIISGYLMCLVMNQRYGFTRKGLRFYLANRFLRIYPPYWFACLASVGVLALLDADAVRASDPAWTWPSSAWGWISNLSFVGLIPLEVNPLVPPAWTLRVEIFYYIAIALVLGRGRRMALAWFGVGVAYHVFVYFYVVDDNPLIPWAARYFTIGAASLPFSLGALVYHYREPILALIRRPIPVGAVVFTMWVANYLYVAQTESGFLKLGFYLNCAISAVLLAVLISLPQMPSRFRRMDSWLGDLSYPIYLMHMQVGAVTAALLGLANWVPYLFVASAPLLMLISWGMTVGIDRPIETLRDRVKRSLEGGRSPRAG